MEDIDFMKGVLILLMISFHLPSFGDIYPGVKQMVYTFHMPAFLIISGYLMNIGKHWRGFLRTMQWLIIPYLVMESGHVIMAAFLPVREHIDSINGIVFMDKLFLHPMGPYWYLRLLIVCGLTYDGVFRLLHLSTISRFILLGLLFYAYDRVLGICPFVLSMYFWTGVVIRQCRLAYSVVFQPFWLAFVAAVVISLHPAALSFYRIEGVGMVYLACSCIIYLYQWTGIQLRTMMVWLGRRTLLLLLFSPVFTLPCRWFTVLLHVDYTGLMFLSVSLSFCVIGCLSIGWMMDRLKLTRYLIGREAWG